MNKHSNTARQNVVSKPIIYSMLERLNADSSFVLFLSGTPSTCRFNLRLRRDTHVSVAEVGVFSAVWIKAAMNLPCSVVCSSWFIPQPPFARIDQFSPPPELATPRKCRLSRGGSWSVQRSRGSILPAGTVSFRQAAGAHSIKVTLGGIRARCAPDMDQRRIIAYAGERFGSAAARFRKSTCPICIAIGFNSSF